MVTSTEPKQRRPSPQGISVSVSRTAMDVVSRAIVEYGGFGLLDQGDRVLQVEGADEIGAALVEVDSALVDGGVRGARVDRAQQPSRALLDDLDRVAAPAADVGQVGGPLTACPVPGAGAAAEQLRGLQLREQGRGFRAEELQVVLDQR